MTCAHVVHVALKKVAGVDSVEVSLNKGLATVKLKSGNTVTVPELWNIIHQNGYSPKNTVVSVRGDLMDVAGQVKLKVSGTNQTIDIVSDAKSPGAYSEAKSRVGQNVLVEGVMIPEKDFKKPVPLAIEAVK